jgi:phage N-6-adenine-methyltransferase
MKNRTALSDFDRPLLDLRTSTLATPRSTSGRGIHNGPREHAMCSRQDRSRETTSDLNDWGTPRWLFVLLAQEFRFTLDVCATKANAMVPGNFISPEEDGLTTSWAKRVRGGVAWMNPTYDRMLAEWMRKAYYESSKMTTVCLIPARVNQKFWWDSVLPGEIRFLKSTLKYTRGGVEMPQAPFASAVVVLGPKVKPSVKWWDARVAAGMRRAG